MSSESKPMDLKNRKRSLSYLYTPHPAILDVGSRRQAQLLSIASLIMGVLLIFALVSRLFFQAAAPAGQISLLLLLVAVLITYLTSRTRFFTIGSIILTLSFAASGFGLVMMGEDPVMAIISTIPLAMIIGSIFLPVWAMAAISILIVVATIALTRLVPGIDTRGVMVMVGTLTGMGAALIAAMYFRNSVEQQRLNEFQKVNRDLHSLQSDLEARVNERTTSLEQRNALLQAVTDFSHITTTSLAENEFLDQAVSFIAEKLKFDHANIFLMDDLGERAILSNASSPEGRAWIANRYQLRIAVGEMSYLVQDLDTLRYSVGQNYYRLPKPASMLESKTNISFPLISGQDFLGLLNLQAATINPDLSGRDILQMIADQIALSLDNIRLVAQLQTRLNEINRLAGQATKTSWEKIFEGQAVGYAYDRLRVLNTTETYPKDVMDILLTGKSASWSSKDKLPAAKLIAPIILRGEVIGVIGYEDEDPKHEWHPEEKLLLETIAARVSLALENSRLIAETQKRADRERIVSQIATRMRETLDIDTVLQTAVEEMRQSLGLEQAEVRLQLGTKPEGKKA